MKFKLFTVLVTIVVTACAVAFCVATSFAWYGQSVTSEESLDYTVDSIEVLSITLSMERMAINIHPAQGVKYGTAAGVSFGDVFTGNLLEDNIEKTAEIGVVKEHFSYYSGTAMDTSAVLRASASMVALRGSGNDVEEIEVGHDVSYIICAQGIGLVMDSSRKLTTLPQTACWIENPDVEGEFIPYALNAEEDFYLLATNASSNTLESHFGIFGESTSFTVATAEMQLEFLVLVWYNKINELIDPLLLQTGKLYINLRIGSI